MPQLHCYQTGLALPSPLFIPSCFGGLAPGLCVEVERPDVCRDHLDEKRGDSEAAASPPEDAAGDVKTGLERSSSEETLCEARSEERARRGKRVRFSDPAVSSVQFLPKIWQRDEDCQGNASVSPFCGQPDVSASRRNDHSTTESASMPDLRQLRNEDGSVLLPRSSGVVFVVGPECEESSSEHTISTYVATQPPPPAPAPAAPNPSAHAPLHPQWTGNQHAFVKTHLRRTRSFPTLPPFEIEQQETVVIPRHTRHHRRRGASVLTLVGVVVDPELEE